MMCIGQEGEMATAVVLNWRRNYNIPRIIESLLEQPFISEVVLWDNDGHFVFSPTADASPFAGDERVLAVHSGRGNIKCLGRYEATLHAANDWIVTCDDDYIVKNWDEIWERAQRHPELITGGMFVNEWKGGLVPRAGVCWDIMLGYGSAFRKEHVALLDQYRLRWGEDSLLEEQADRIFACLFAQKHQVVKAHVQALPGYDGEMSLHRDKTHHERVRLARRRAAKLVLHRLGNAVDFRDEEGP